MKQLSLLAISFFCTLICHQSLEAQNVGIGVATPTEKLDIAGVVKSTGIKIAGQNVLELGSGLTKQTDNGKLGLNVFGEANTLSIVGGGTDANGIDRRIKMWADGGTIFTGGAQFGNNVGIGTAPGSFRLVLRSNNSNLLSLENSTAMGTNVATTLNFGGSNYTAAQIQSIGTSSNTARLGFFTGYSFSGGLHLMQERLSIANNGYVGINTSSPETNLHVRGNIRITDLVGTGNRPIYADAQGNLTDSAASYTLMLNAADFMPVSTNSNSYLTVDRSTPGSELYYFRNTTGGATAGSGYFTTPLNLPKGARITEITVYYRSKKPENNLDVSNLAYKMGAMVYSQGVDPTFGGISVKAKLITDSDYSISTSTWTVSGGGAAVSGTTKTAGNLFTPTDGLSNSLVIWSHWMQAGGTAYSTTDFMNYSFWPNNGGLMFHSVKLTYSF
ncbi:hypothetical protein [Phnomibacter ginsenosidimutans]|uniref:hypothetical protein n=1 Tax=Phnomibacter ginsenosidimutans TaxID=2676868 RepID=UPI0018D22A26|nr:hypothetical protein [Phnomibacter ginsenosidimutans]